MPTAVGDPGLRRRSLLLCAGIGLLGAAILAFSASTIYVFAMSVASSAAAIVWDEGGWIGLPIGLSLLALALAIHIGRHDAQGVAGRRREAIRRLLILAVCMLQMAMALPLSAHWLAGRYLEARGYNECIYGVWIAVGRVPEVAKTPASCRGLSGSAAIIDASPG